MKKRDFLKLGLATACLTAFAGGLVACDDGEEVSTYKDLWIDRTLYTFQVGDTMELNVYNGKTEITDVVWESEDSKFVTVDENGKLTAVATGTANVTAKVGEQEFVCKVTVLARTVDFLSVYDSVNLDIDDDTSNKDEYPRSVDLGIVIDLNKVNTELPISYSSANPSVATVENGVITAVKKGSTVVTASTVVGGITYSKAFDVAVYPKSIPHNYEAAFIKVEDSFGDGLEFPYTAAGEIDSVRLDDMKLSQGDYEISEGKILLKKSAYRKDGVTQTGRHNLYISVLKNESESDRYCFPFVLADYVLTTVEEVKALSDEADIGGIKGAYILIAQDIEYTETTGYSSRASSAGVLNGCTIDGYGHSLINWNVSGGWGIFGTISNSEVMDLSVVNAQIGSKAHSLLFTTVTGVRFENLFISISKNKGAGGLRSIIGVNVKSATMKNCVILSQGEPATFDLGRVDNSAAATSLTIDGNVFVSDSKLLLDTAKQVDCIQSVNGENAIVGNGDSAGLIAALRALAAKGNNFTFDETTNTLSLFGNVVYTVETGE